MSCSLLAVLKQLTGPSFGGGGGFEGVALGLTQFKGGVNGKISPTEKIVSYGFEWGLGLLWRCSHYMHPWMRLFFSRQITTPYTDNLYMN